MSSALYVNRNSSEASGTRSSPHYFEMGWGMSFCCFQLSMDIDIKQENTCTVWSHSSAQQWLTFSHTGSILTRMFQVWHYNTCISTKMYFWKETEVKCKWWWGSTQDVKYLDCSKEEVWWSLYIVLNMHFTTSSKLQAWFLLLSSWTTTLLGIQAGTVEIIHDENLPLHYLRSGDHLSTVNSLW